MSKYTDHLGMNPGTARNRLVNMLLYEHVVKDQVACFVCEHPIESWEEMSIEHKIPWRFAPNAQELFFDLGNVTFSHRLCNRPRSQRKIGPEGTAWCYSCEEFLPLVRFSKFQSRWNGVQYLCKECEKPAKALRNKKRAKVPELA